MKEKDLIHKKSKRNTTVSSMLWKNYLLMVTVSVALVVIPYIMFLFVCQEINNRNVYQHLSANDLMRDDWSDIPLEQVEKMNGGIQIVTKDLQVISLGGRKEIEKEQLSVEEWTAFLVKSGGIEDVECDIAYNSKEQFWLIVELPTMMIRLEYVENSDMVEYHTIHRWYWILGIFYLLLLVAAAVIYAHITARNFKKPLDKICSFTRQIETGAYGEKIPLQGAVEFQVLQKNLNHMSEELQIEKQNREQAEDNRKRLIRDISHDLKNPMTSIQGYAELCLKHAELDQEKQREYMELIQKNSVQANRLLNSLFLFSKLDSPEFLMEKEKVDMVEFLREQIIKWIPVLEEHNFAYEVDIPEEHCEVEIDTFQMERVLDNLFENTMAYNQQGMKITISFATQDKSVKLVFADDGIGIAREMIPSIFHAFVRNQGEVRNSGDGGSGLGLAIVEKIITLHGGNITLESDSGKGCRFCIMLPKECDFKKE